MLDLRSLQFFVKRKKAAMDVLPAKIVINTAIAVKQKRMDHRMKKEIIDISKFSCLCMALVSVSALFYCIPSKDFSWLFIIWNVFLAVIPLYMALFVKLFSEKNRTVLSALFSFLWLLFFPNAFYMLTDLKYFSNFSAEVWNAMSMTLETMTQWLFLANAVISVCCGILCGLLSLLYMHCLFIEKWGRVKSIFIVGVIFLLTAFGIYIGRFARLNSWDILRPWYIFEKMGAVLTPFCLFFVLLFAFLAAVLYLLFYFVFRRGKKTCPSGSRN